MITFIHLSVNNFRTKALVDSGACQNCVSLDFVNKMNLKLLPLTSKDPAHHIGADGRALICTGTVDLTINIQGLKIPQKFAIVKGMNFHIGQCDCHVVQYQTISISPTKLLSIVSHR